jgi:deoxyribodipyrimidine photolyase
MRVGVLIFEDQLNSENPALLRAMEVSSEVYPVFILNKDFLERNKPGFPYVYFLFESVLALKNKIKERYHLDLEIRYGSVYKELKEFVTENKIKKIFTTEQFTVHGKKLINSLKRLKITILAEKAPQLSTVEDIEKTMVKNPEWKRGMEKKVARLEKFYERVREKGKILLKELEKERKVIGEV